jgi:hypothetical protein
MPWAGAEWQDDEGTDDDWRCPVCDAALDDECRATIEQSCFWNTRGTEPVLPPYEP